jgi:Entner-Doudoroff aldolase
MIPDSISKRIESTGIVAVLVIDREEDGPELAKALLEGGVDIMELTLRTPAAIGALRRIRAEVPDMLAGAGTVLTPAQVEEVKNAGAEFAVSPGVNPRVMQAAKEAGLPFAPGISTPSDIEQALEFDCRLLKFFPAEASGGLARLTRNSIIEVMGQDYIRTARAKGLTTVRVVAKHAMRNAMIPPLTLLGIQFALLIGGAVVTETVFARPGIGKLLVQAVLEKDFPVVQGIVVLTTGVYVLINVLIDIAYGIIDPRVQE